MRRYEDTRACPDLSQGDEAKTQDVMSQSALSEEGERPAEAVPGPHGHQTVQASEAHVQHQLLQNQVLPDLLQKALASADRRGEITVVILT